MAITDRLGATVDATEAPSSSTPNAGLAVKTAVRAATTGSNIMLSGLQTMDGIALAAGDRVLVKDQSNQTLNGVYNVSTGPWAASSDFQNNTQLGRGALVFVTDGVSNAGSLWWLAVANPVVVGSSALVFSPFNLSAPRQRAVRSSGDLPVLTADSVVNFNAATDLTPAVPPARGRAGAELSLKNLPGSHVQTLSFSDGADGAVSLALVPGASLTLRPYNDGVNEGYAIV
jgi:phage-related tail fiber protein